MSPPLFSAGVPCGTFLSSAPGWIAPWLCDTNPWNAVHLSTGAIVYAFVGDPFIVVFLNALFEAFEYTVGELTTAEESFFKEYYIEHVMGDPFVTLYGLVLVTTIFWNRRWAPGYPQIARWRSDPHDTTSPRETYLGSTFFWLPERLTPTWARARLVLPAGIPMALAATVIVNFQKRLPPTRMAPSLESPLLPLFLSTTARSWRSPSLVCGGIVGRVDRNRLLEMVNFSARILTSHRTFHPERRQLLTIPLD
jgi:hypothetical protein